MILFIVLLSTFHCICYFDLSVLLLPGFVYFCFLWTMLTSSAAVCGCLKLCDCTSDSVIKSLGDKMSLATSEHWLTDPKVAYRGCTER